MDVFVLTQQFALSPDLGQLFLHRQTQFRVQEVRRQVSWPSRRASVTFLLL